MQLSSKTQNACLAILELSLRFDQPQPVSLRTIAEPHHLSTQFLVQILLQLKRAGLVCSVRGAAGGYRLTVPPDQISLWDVITAVEGPPSGAPDFEIENPVGRVLHDTWLKISTDQQRQLTETTFDQLVERAQSATADMYYI